MGAEERRPLELALNEAIALAYYVRQDGTTPLRVKIFDAILQLESGVAPPFSMGLTERECWLIDEVIREDSKALDGTSLRPLLRRIWRLIVEWHEHELLHPPALAVSQEGDTSYQARLGEVKRDADTNTGQDTDADAGAPV